MEKSKLCHTFAEKNKKKQFNTMEEKDMFQELKNELLSRIGRSDEHYRIYNECFKASSLKELRAAITGQFSWYCLHGVLDEQIIDDYLDQFKEMNVFVNRDVRNGHLLVTKGEYKANGNALVIVLNGSLTARGSVEANCYNNSKINAAGSCTVNLWGDSTGDISGNCNCYAFDNSKCRVYMNARADLFDNSEAMAFNRSKMVLTGNAHAVLNDDSYARCYDNTSVRVKQQSTAELFGNSNASAYGYGRVFAYGNNDVRLFELSTLYCNGNDGKFKIYATDYTHTYLHECKNSDVEVSASSFAVVDSFIGLGFQCEVNDNSMIRDCSNGDVITHHIC